MQLRDLETRAKSCIETIHDLFSFKSKLPTWIAILVHVVLSCSFRCHLLNLVNSCNRIRQSVASVSLYGTSPLALDDAQTPHHVPCTLLCPIMGVDCGTYTHQFLPMIFIKLRSLLAQFRSYILAHCQHEGHTRRVLFPTEFSEYFIVGEGFGQAVDADIVEIEDVRYFDTFSKTTEGEDIRQGKSFRRSIQDESTHASFTHSLMLLPTFCFNKISS